MSDRLQSVVRVHEQVHELMDYMDDDPGHHVVVRWRMPEGWCVWGLTFAEWVPECERIELAAQAGLTSDALWTTAPTMSGETTLLGLPEGEYEETIYIWEE